MSFSDIATQIVKKSIRSAICIDDAFAEPYETPTDDFSDDIPKKMYESFRDKGNCSLDFYRYRDIEHWGSNSEFLLSNKDLIVLDWELDKIAPKYKNTLSILDDIIQNGTNQFVIIYTHLEHLENIVISLQAFYNQTNIYTKAVKEEMIIDAFESSGAEFSDLGTSLERNIDFVNIFTPVIKLSTILSDAKLQGKEIGEFVRKSKAILGVKTDDEVLEFLLLNNHKLREYSCSSYRNVQKVDCERVILNIENTIILISNKSVDGEDGEKILPENLFGAFTDAITKKPNNAMALMACNFKDIFRSNVASIGNNIPKINEQAFYHHWSNIRKEEDLTEKEADEQFKDFLLQTWMNELSQFTIKTSSNNTFFEALLKYGEENQLFDDVKGVAPVEDLIKLGAHYSTINLDVTRRSDRKIQFGDIFWKQDSSTTMDDVLLSVTPHCDSIRPEKINNLLHFVRGRVLKNKDEIKIALQNSETDHYSFINIAGKPFCVEWFTKPFSIFIKKENNDVTKLIQIKLKDVGFKLIHITLLKENYTQRIANHSFSHAMRVGITLPSLKN